MKKRITVVTGNPYLWQKIYLTMKYDAEVVRTDAPEGEICLFDLDTAELPEGAKVIRMAREGECELSVPFTEEGLRAAIDKRRGGARLSLSERVATLDGEDIRLTEVEAALLGRLMAAGGEFVAREELLRDVWGGEADGGVINVYIHYLREKLERRGEKIILSSRKSGYKIEGKYLIGGAVC